MNEQDSELLDWASSLGSEPPGPPAESVPPDDSAADAEFTAWAETIPVQQSQDDLRQMIQQSDEPMGWLATTASRTTPGVLARAINRAIIGDSYVEPAAGDFGYVGNLASEITSFLVDPVLHGGGSVGGKIASKAIGKGTGLARSAGRSAIQSGTALGTMTAVQNPAEQYIESGEVDPLETVIETGKSTALGAALGATGRVAGKLAIPAETVVLGAGGAALQGRAPTTDDFLDAAALVIGLKGTAGLARLATRLRSRGPEEDPMAIAVEEIGQEKTTEVLRKLQEPGAQESPGTLTGFQEPPKTVTFVSPEVRENLLSVHEGHLSAGRADPTPSKQAFRDAGAPPEVAEGTRRERAAFVESLKQEQPLEAQQNPFPGNKAEQSGVPPKEPAGDPVGFEEAQRATSIQNATVDRERAARGLPPAMEPAMRGFGAVRDDVLREIAANPGRSEILVRELKDNPRPITDTEDGLLLHRQITLQNEFDKTIRKLDTARSAGEPEAIAVLEAQVELQLSRLGELYDINKAVGTANSRGLNARKMLADEDFSLVKMRHEKRSARGGEELPKEVAEQVKVEQQKIADLQRQYDELLARKEAFGSEQAGTAAVERVVKAVGSKRESRKTVARAKVESAWKDFESKATGKIFSNPLDPEILGSAARLAKAYIELGVANVSEFIDRVRERIGDEKAEKARETLTSAWRSAAEESKPKPRNELKESADISRFAKELAEHFVSLGVRERDQLVESVHRELLAVKPEITKRQSMDAISGYGDFKPLSKDEIKVALRDLKGQMQQVAKIEDMQAGMAPLKTGLERRTPSDQESRLIKEVNKLKQKGGFNVRDSAVELKSALASFKTRTENRIAEYEERLARGDFAERTRKTTPLDAEAERLRFKLEEARSDWHRGLEADRRARRTVPEKIYEGGAEVLNASRAILTSVDLSAVRRQGGFLVSGHPLRAAKSLGPMLRSFASKAEASRVMHEIASRKNAPLYKRSGLSLTGIDGKLSAQEEAYMSRWSKKIPLVAGSERAYVVFLDLLRADSFDAMAKSLSRRGSVTEAEAKVISNFINVATGRGDLGKFKAAAVPLATVFFSPRYVASRFQLLSLQPLRKGILKEPAWRARGIVAAEYGRALAGTALYYTLAGSALYALIGPPGDRDGWDVQWDPRSSDFGKIRIGNTRIDPLFGLQQATVLLSRLVSGKTKTIGGKVKDIRGPKVPFGGDDSYDVMSRFLRTKLSPVLATTWDILSGKNVVGEPTTAAGAAKSLLVPISLRDVYNSMKEQGIPAGTALWILSVFGDGVQTYEERRKASRPAA